MRFPCLGKSFSLLLIDIRFLFSLLHGVDLLRGLFSDMCMADLSVDLWQFYMLIATLGGTIVVDESSHIKACFQLHKDS